MSGTFPTDPAPATVTLNGLQPTIVRIAESGKRQSRIGGGHLWKAKFSWSRMTRDMLAPIFAFANLQRGRFGSFQIVLPNYAVPNGVATGSPQVLAGTKGSTFAYTSGWTSNITGILKAGDVIKFANHSKVYMVNADVDSDGSGNGTVLVTPPLIESLVYGQVVTVNDVEFTMSLDDDVLDWKGSAPNMAIISLGMTESL